MLENGIVLVKWGGSLITDKTQPQTSHLAVIERLAQELGQTWEALQGRLVLGHGSGSFGHVAAARFDLQSGVTRSDQRPGISRTQQQAARLHHLVLQALAEVGVPPFSVAPSSALVASGGTPVAFEVEPVRAALQLGLLPVLYGDVVVDREQGVSICSTETVLRALADELKQQETGISRVIWLGNTEGIYDAEGATIPRVTPNRADAVLQQIEGPEGTDVTGGMRHRLITALALARSGIPSLIANGTTPGLFERALQGKRVPGTRVIPPAGAA